jgi:membrane protease YdiL (CAAX protease family)
MKHSRHLALLGAAVALAVTATMDATGLTMFSALPLIPLTVVFWVIQKMSRREMGLAWGTREGYGLALLYPVVVPGVLAGLAFAFGDVDTSATEWSPVLLQLALASSVGVLGTLLTEEGFFRGWLPAAFARAGHSPRRRLLVSTGVFTLWHFSAVALTEEFGLPPAQWPVYLANVFLIGWSWALMRHRSGSVIVPSVSHAVWNALVYGLFGMGAHQGALGMQKTHLFAPEVGLLGIVANAAFAVWLTRRVAPPTSAAARTPRRPGP